jgi:hypothetical protein
MRFVICIGTRGVSFGRWPFVQRYDSGGEFQILFGRYSV